MTPSLLLNSADFSLQNCAINEVYLNNDFECDYLPLMN